MKAHLTLLVFLLPFVLHAQIITTFAGGGSSAPNSVPSLTANIPGATGGVFDSHGNYYFVGYSTSNRVYKIDTSGIITYFAGTGSAGYNGDGGNADTSMLKQPYSVTVDTLDNVYIADAGNNRIRKVDAFTNLISTVAGNGINGFSGDSGLAVNATLNFPGNVCFDKHGNLYIADGNNFRIRIVNTLGIINTYAGNGTLGTMGDGGAATLAQVCAFGLCVDDSDNLFFSAASVGQCRIGKINNLTHIVSTIAGTDTGYVYNADDIPAVSANITPTTIRFDNIFQYIYVTDYFNNRIRRIDVDGIIHTVVGNGIEGFSGDNGYAPDAELYYPSGLTFDTCGNLYFGDQFNDRIRKVAFNPACWPEAVETPTKSSTVNLYPNPSYSTITIASPLPIDSVTITNTLGQQVYTHTFSTTKSEIDISHLPQGIYIVRINNVYVQKLVKE